MNDPKTASMLPADSDLSEVSDRIRARVQAAGRRFHANDNISDFIDGEAELDALESEITAKMQAVLETLVIDTESDHNTHGTARRVARIATTRVLSRC